MVLGTRGSRSLVLSGVLLIVASLGLARAQDAAPGDVHRLVVVELFQSQGCSSCPPADANVNAVAGRPDVLALSYAVTYWDGLGWKDTFAQPAFTDRQYAYAHHRGRSQVWTPQVYVNGKTDLIGSDRPELERAIARATASGGPRLHWSPGRLQVEAGQPVPGGCDVWLVRYDPRTLQVPIDGGENRGRLLPHRDIVRELIHLGHWDGQAATYAVPAATLPGLATAALVQAGEGGAILSAARQR